MRTTALSVFSLDPKRIGGVEMFAREISVQLDSAGWDSVLCFNKPATREVAGFLDLPNTRVEAHPEIFGPQVRAIAGFRRLLKTVRPDIVHFHFLPGLTPFPWLAKLSGVERIYTTDHSSREEGDPARRLGFLKAAVGRSVWSPVTKVVSVSRYVEKCNRELEVLRPEQISMIYNGVDRRRVSSAEAGFAFRIRNGIPKNSILVMQISKLIPQKGFPDLLRAAKLVIEDNPNVCFALVGEGQYESAYRALARQLEIADHVFFTGLSPDPLMDGTLASADILCQVSRWEEAFGWSIVEAMAHGKPVIASRAGGIPEIVSDRRNGYLVDRGDVPCIAERILRLARDVRLRKTLGEAGRADVEERFDLKENVSAMLNMYGIETRCTNAKAFVRAGV